MGGDSDRERRVCDPCHLFLYDHQVHLKIATSRVSLALQKNIDRDQHLCSLSLHLLRMQKTLGVMMHLLSKEVPA